MLGLTFFCGASHIFLEGLWGDRTHVSSSQNWGWWSFTSLFTIHIVTCRNKCPFSLTLHCMTTIAMCRFCCGRSKHKKRSTVSVAHWFRRRKVAGCKHLQPREITHSSSFLSLSVQSCESGGNDSKTTTLYPYSFNRGSLDDYNDDDSDKDDSIVPEVVHQQFEFESNDNNHVERYCSSVSSDTDEKSIIVDGSDEVPESTPDLLDLDD